MVGDGRSPYLRHPLNWSPGAVLTRDPRLTKAMHCHCATGAAERLVFETNTREGAHSLAPRLGTLADCALHELAEGGGLDPQTLQVPSRFERAPARLSGSPSTM